MSDGGSQDRNNLTMGDHANRLHQQGGLAVGRGQLRWVGLPRAHPIWGVVVYTKAVRVVIHRGRRPGPVKLTPVLSSVGRGVWCLHRCVQPVSSQQMSQFLVKMPLMPKMLRVGGWVNRQRRWARWVRSKGVGRCPGWAKAEMPPVQTHPKGVVNQALRWKFQVNLALRYTLHTIPSPRSPAPSRRHTRKEASRT